MPRTTAGCHGPCLEIVQSRHELGPGGQGHTVRPLRPHLSGVVRVRLLRCWHEAVACQCSAHTRPDGLWRCSARCSPPPPTVALALPKSTFNVGTNSPLRPAWTSRARISTCTQWTGGPDHSAPAESHGFRCPGAFRKIRSGRGRTDGGRSFGRGQFLAVR